jgi:O-antigen ligase
VKRAFPSSPLPSIRAKSGRGLLLLLVAIPVAALAGRAAAAASLPQAAVLIGASIVLVLAAGASHTGRTPLELFGSVVLLLAAMVDWPRNFNVGPITALGAITIVYVIVCVFLWISETRPPLLHSGWGLYLCFITWALISFLWHPPSTEGFQNVAVFSVFGILMLVTAEGCSVRPETAVDLGRWLDRAAALAVSIYLISVAIYTFETGKIFSPRAFANFALLGLVRALARFRYESRRAVWLGLAAFAAIFASLSRTSLASCLILIPLAWLDRRSFSRRAGVVLVSLIAIGVFALAAVSVGPLEKRFAEPNTVKVGGIDLSVSGRGVYWVATWRSFLTSPLIGHGAGSSETLVKQFLSPRQRRNYGHPHNDYLRLMHDYGVIGFGLWFGSFVVFLRRTRRAWMEAVAEGDPTATIHMTAFLALLAIGLGMITDNAVVYINISAPLALLVGSSLGLSMRSRAKDRTLRRGGSSRSPDRIPVLT